MPLRPHVLMATEGTYPFADGGVSTWCHQLCESLSGVDFTLLAATGDARVEWRYPRAASVKRVVHVPLWPGGDSGVLVGAGTSGAARRRRIGAPRSAVAGAGYLSPLWVILREVFLGATPIESLVDAFVRLGVYLQRHDYVAALRDRATWDAVREALVEYSATEAARAFEPPTLGDVAVCARWLYHMLKPLAARLPPDVTVYHATATAPCALPGVVARVASGMGFVLTEHGVYVRERYLYVGQSAHSPTEKRFLAGLAAATARACYATADVIAPVAAFNARWQLPFGADPSRIRVIHNGVDAERFCPRESPRRADARPTAVAVAHVFPLKDIETMIRAAAVARRTVADLRVRVHGSLDRDRAYAQRCRARIDDLSLGGCFELAGYTPVPHEAFHDGDVSVLSSISEGFPYTVIESMACGVPCVATDVGGVREAIGDAGVVVPPRDPIALGRAMAELLVDDARRRELARRARERVVARFTIERQLEGYARVYRELHEATAARALRGAAVEGMVRA